jgi:hypothetical protein
MSDVVLAGTVNPASGASTGMVYSTDEGESFVQVSAQPWLLDDESVISDFAHKNGRIYTAVQAAGLFVSPDAGTIWDTVPLGDHFAAPSLNSVYSLAFLEDTLFVGTDSGLVELTLDIFGAITAAAHEPFTISDTSSTRIVRIRVQPFENDITPGQIDSTVIWTVNRPSGAIGTPIVGRRSADGSWTYLRRGLDIYDINFFTDTVFAVGETAIWFSPRGEEPTNFFSARQLIQDTLVVDNLDNDTVTTMEVLADTVVFGCSNGVAISHDRGESFRIYRANRDTLAADFVVNHSYLSSLGGLAGDFIPSLAIQYLPSDTARARVWAGCRPATFGYIGMSFGEYDSSGALIWNVVNEDDYAWNFEFDTSIVSGDTIGIVFAATNSGLLRTDDLKLDSLDTEWEAVSFTDQSSGERLIEPGTAAYGLALVDDYLWVGTDDGTVALSRADLGDVQLFKRVDLTTPADEVYAFPVPFRPNLGQTVDFHFTIEQAGSVTLSIYDFAMNLVATPINNVHYDAGIYPSMSSQGTTWDGFNDKGDLVAVGVYYFKVEDGSGEAHWGKLAVIP